MDFIGKALAPDGTADDDADGAEETELGGDFWDDFLSAPPLPRASPPVPTPLLGSRRLRERNLELVLVP